MSFWSELKRRNVYKVGIAYLIVAWLIVQAAAIVFPHLNLPSWAVTFVIVILIIGFPLVLIFAYAFEITPTGLKRTKQVPLHESITYITGRRLNYILAGLLMVAVAFILFDNYYLDRRAVEKEIASIETEPAPIVIDVKEGPKTIAVLPFVDISPEKDQEYFVDGLSEEILNSLAQIPDLTVIARTSSFTFKGSNKKVQEIGNELGVENILEGSVRKAGNALRITAQLVKAVDGSHLWSNTYDRELKDIFAVQEDIATAVASELETTLGIGTSFKQLGGTDNIDAYALYLKALGSSAQSTNFLESINKAIALDPKFALAWVSKAVYHDNNARFMAANRVHAELDEALRAVMKAIELEPNLVGAYAALADIRVSQGKMIEAASAYDKAYNLSNKSLVGHPAYSTLIKNAGYLKKYNELLEASLISDPINAEITRADYIGSLAQLGDMKRAEEEYEFGKKIYGEGSFLGNLIITNCRLTSGDAVSSDDIVVSDPIHDTAKKHLDSPKEGLAELYRYYTEVDNIDTGSLVGISFWAVYFDDPELAMDAIEKAVSSNSDAIFNCWYPSMKQIRQLPRFKKLVKDIGLVDYWNQFGWPDLCRPLDNGDFVCD